MPFTSYELRNYKKALNWERVSGNEKIVWTIDLIEEFQDLLDFVARDEYEKLEIFQEFNLNRALPWSIELIEKFREKWDWELLSQNEGLLANTEVRNYCFKEFLPYNEVEILAGYPAREDNFFNNLSSNILSFTKNIEQQVSTMDEINNLQNINWSSLSSNQLLPWSADLIRKYLNKWNWDTLSDNHSIPWSVEILQEFEDYWCWGGEYISDDGRIFPKWGLSWNPALPWSIELFKLFKHRFVLESLLINEGVKWDIDILIELKEMFDDTHLSIHEDIWNKVFYEFNTPEKSYEVLDLIMKG